MEVPQEMMGGEGLPEEKPKEKFEALPEMVNNWKEFYLREGHSFHSTMTYYNYIKRFVGYGTFINQKTIDKFRISNTSSASSGAVKNFLNFLVNKKGFPREIQYIHFDKSKSTKKFPKHISTLEVEKIINGMPDLKFKNLTLVISTLALRLSEALKLRWSNFSWITWLEDKTKSGTVNLIDTKGGKFRSIPVPQFLMEKLYNEHPRRNNLGVPIGNDPSFDIMFDFGLRQHLEGKENLEEKQYNYIVVHAEDKYRKVLYRVSLEVLGKRINPHQLRHTRSQDLLDRGLPISSLQTYLGHSSIKSTEIYAQASPEKLRADMERLNITN
jgi:integrase